MRELVADGKESAVSLTVKSPATPTPAQDTTDSGMRRQIGSECCRQVPAGVSPVPLQTLHELAYSDADVAAAAASARAHRPVLFADACVLAARDCWCLRAPMRACER